MKIVAKKIQPVKKALVEKKKIFFNQSIIKNRILLLSETVQNIMSVDTPYKQLLIDTAIEAASKDLTETITNYVANAGDTLFHQLPANVEEDDISKYCAVSKFITPAGIKKDVDNDKELDKLLLKESVADTLIKNPVLFKSSGVDLKNPCLNKSVDFIPMDSKKSPIDDLKINNETLDIDLNALNDHLNTLNKINLNIFNKKQKMKSKKTTKKKGRRNKK